MPFDMSKAARSKTDWEGVPVLLRTEDVHKSYQSAAGRLDVLMGVDLQVRRGEIVVIVGASGAGKSTLLHILGALDQPTSGRVHLDGTNLFSLSDRQLARVRNNTLGFVFQFHHLLPDFSALENVAMPLLIGGCEVEAARQTAMDILDDVGLRNRAHQKPGQLSGGEQQRVAVARALVNEPLVVLADEPSGNLDRSNSEMLHDLIWQLSRSKQQAFVIVTHNETLARRADRQLRLVDGSLKSMQG
jgi:lipoprotein-releasing system ATP-binding protein